MKINAGVVFSATNKMILRLFIFLLCGWCGIAPTHATLHSSTPTTPAKSVEFRAYFRDPYHNPETGRFWTQDSYEGNGSDPASLHKYTYCHNNPVRLTDPSGHISVAEASAVSAIRSIVIEMNVTSGFAAHDAILYGPTAATANLYTGAAIGAAIPFARVIAKPLSKLANIAEAAIRGGAVSLARLQLRSSYLVQPYEMLLETMRLGGISGYQGGHILPSGLFPGVPRNLGLAIPMAGSTAEKFSQHWKFHRTIEVAWDYYKQAYNRYPTVEEFVNKILPDALQNADVDPLAALVLSEAAEKQALKFGYDLATPLPNVIRNTTQ